MTSAATRTKLMKKNEDGDGKKKAAKKKTFQTLGAALLLGAIVVGTYFAYKRFSGSKTSSKSSTLGSTSKSNIASRFCACFDENEVNIQELADMLATHSTATGKLPGGMQTNSQLLKLGRCIAKEIREVFIRYEGIPDPHDRMKFDYALLVSLFEEACVRDFVIAFAEAKEEKEGSRIFGLTVDPDGARLIANAIRELLDFVEKEEKGHPMLFEEWGALPAGSRIPITDTNRASFSAVSKALLKQHSKDSVKFLVETIPDHVGYYGMGLLALLQSDLGRKRVEEGTEIARDVDRLAKIRRSQRDERDE